MWIRKSKRIIKYFPWKLKYFHTCSFPFIFCTFPRSQSKSETNTTNSISRGERLRQGLGEQRARLNQKRNLRGSGRRGWGKEKINANTNSANGRVTSEWGARGPEAASCTRSPTSLPPLPLSFFPANCLPRFPPTILAYWLQTQAKHRPPGSPLR